MTSRITAPADTGQGIRIVLVETTHPGNIGAAARAMKTMCLDQLYLVNPHHYPSAEATARASGADDVLAQATLCSSLQEAIAGCGLVMGTSARLRSLSWSQVDPRQCAEQAMRACGTMPVALVFGREHSGLSNEEMMHCHALVNIPSNPEYSSLNLGSAVQVLCYELMMARTGGGAESDGISDDAVAPVEEVERLYAHLETVMIETEFLDPANPRHLMRRLRRLFNRVRLERNEVNILRGILTSFQDKLRR